MAVVSCNVALGEFSGMPIPGLDSEFEIPYNIITNAATDNTATIFASGVLNPRFTQYPDNIFATLRRTSIRRDPKSHWSRAVWRAVEHYSSVPLTEKEEEQQLSPLDRAAYIDWETVPYQVPVLVGEKTLAGGTKVWVPIVNSAGDTPDPVPEKTEYYARANIIKNITSRPSWLNDGYPGAVNIAPFYIEGLLIPAECACMVDLKLSRKMKENDVRFRQLSFSLLFRTKREQRTNASGVVLASDVPPPPFDLELADMGLHKLDSATGNRTKFMTDDTPARPVGQPILMDGLGDKLANPTPYNMVLSSWRILRKKDFSVLPLV